MPSLRSVRDEDLLRQLFQLVKQSRGVEAEIVAHVGEAERRRLYAREACSSMFEYCRRILSLRENEAYLRITVARAARELPILLEMLRDGRLHLSGMARLAPHLNRADAQTVLERASGMSHREVRELVAELEPRPDIAPTIRKIAERAAPSSGSTLELGAPRVEPDAVKLESRVAVPARPARVEPLAPARYQVRFTASAELREKLERLQALMRGSVPGGDLSRIIDIAISEKLQRVEAKRFGHTKAPRVDPAVVDTNSSSRHVPAAVRRLVHARDGGRSRVSPQAPLRARRRPQPRQPDPDVPGTQHSAGGAGLR